MNFMSNWRLQAQLKGMLEPEAEESPGYHSPDEGLEEDFRRLSLGVEPPRVQEPLGPSASAGRVVEPASPSSEPETAEPENRRLDLVVRVAGRSVWIVRGFADTAEDRAAELSDFLRDRFPQRRGQPDLRFYTVWVLPHYRGTVSLAGIHIGLDDRAYGGILTANNNHFEGLRFRRVSSIVEGRRLFQREADRHRVDRRGADSYFLWE